MIKSITDINQITAAIYVDPSSQSCQSNLSTSAYYALLAQDENLQNGGYKPGINKFTVESGAALQIACEAFSQNTETWNSLDSYFGGQTEPSDTPALRGIYDQLRHQEQCYTAGYMFGRYTPDQVLMLRFFQSVKENFSHYYAPQISDAYKEIDAYAAANKSTLPDSVQAALANQNRLMGDSLLKMNRTDTLRAMNQLSNVQNILAAAGAPHSQVDKLVELANTYLYQLRCLDGTWHEYDPHQRLAAPTCGPGVQ
jgi:hypothetical protein